MYSIEIQIYLEKYISHFQVIRDLFCVFTFHFFFASNLFLANFIFLHQMLCQWVYD